MQLILIKMKAILTIFLLLTTLTSLCLSWKFSELNYDFGFEVNSK